MKDALLSLDDTQNVLPTSEYPPLESSHSRNTHDASPEVPGDAFFQDWSMKREDYIFCIGYQGDSAIVDGQAKRQYAKASVDELSGKGLFKFALCAALYDKDEAAVRRIIEQYNALSGLSLKSREEIMRLLGVTEPSEAITKTVVIK